MVSDNDAKPRKKRLSTRKKRRSPHILLLVEMSRAYGRGIIEGIARFAQENGPWSIQFEERALDSEPPVGLKSWQGDGIIVRTSNRKLLDLLKATQLPLIDLFADRWSLSPEIRPDMDAAGKMAADHLIDYGHRHVAYFTFEEAMWTKLTRDGFHKALKDRGFDCNSFDAMETKQTVPVWRESERPRVVEWLQSLPKPIGIYTAGDLHAVRLLEICRENQIAVPEEISILGCGNDSVICETAQPTLSSLDLDPRRIGFEAAKLLDRKLKGKPIKDGASIPPSHIAVRQSTDHIAVEDPRIVQAILFIRNNACEGIDVSRVAEEVGISRVLLDRQFRARLGRTPKAEILRFQIEKAKSLLAKTDHSGKSIALKCGFATLAYFTKAFRREVGATPIEFRKMRRISRDYNFNLQ
jgi:LacI family transcriptional regulator